MAPASQSASQLIVPQCHSARAMVVVGGGLSLTVAQNELEQLNGTKWAYDGGGTPTTSLMAQVFAVAVFVVFSLLQFVVVTAARHLLFMLQKLYPKVRFAIVSSEESGGEKRKDKVGNDVQKD